MRKFTGKMPDASDTTSIEHRPLTVTVKTSQCGHTAWGKMNLIDLDMDNYSYKYS